MKVVDLLGNKEGFSLELLPPKLPCSGEDFASIIADLLDVNPLFMNVTSHRNDVKFDVEEGNIVKRLVRTKLSDLSVCSFMSWISSVPTVPHIICSKISKDLLESLLMDYKFLGIENLMVLRGDCLLGERRFEPIENGYLYASSLIEDIKKLDSSFCLGAACYPEKHFESTNLEHDIDVMLKKQDLGVDYFITQMFFDNNKFYSFVSLARSKGVTVPIIPGIKPITKMSQLSFLPQTFNISIPYAFTSRVSRDTIYEGGLAWCQSQIDDLKT